MFTLKWKIWREEADGNGGRKASSAMRFLVPLRWGARFTLGGFMFPFRRAQGKLKGGWTDLASLVILAGLVVTGAMLASAILEVRIVKEVIERVGTRTSVGVVINPVDEGTELNSFLLVDKGKGRYSEILGLMAAGGGGKEDIRETLESAGLSLVLKDGRKVVFPGEGVGEERFVDFPLPGFGRGRLGIDAE
jgi:hypothetical protein